MTAPSKRVTGVLLDIDGTLLDSNDAHAQSWVEIFRRYRYDVPFERVRPLIGKGSDKLLPDLTGLDSEAGKGKQMAEERRQLFLRDYLPKLCPTRGARYLVKRLRDDGFCLVVATSSSGEELDQLLRQVRVDDLIEKATSSSDAENSKPDPDIIQAALKEGKLRPEEAVMLGDTPYDIEAAGRTGVPTIALRCGGWWDDAALAGAVATYDDPAAPLVDIDRSPLAAGPKKLWREGREAAKETGSDDREYEGRLSMRTASSRLLASIRMNLPVPPVQPGKLVHIE